MKEHPIIFSGEMVRAILARRKTQTRRVVKIPLANDVTRFVHDKEGNWWVCNSDGKGAIGKCPYGVPGDHLWVRETFKSASYDDYGRGASERVPFYRADEWTEERWLGWQRANGKCPPKGMPWKPSIYMPRWASRITLEIASIRVEQVQDIDYDNAKEEGIVVTGNVDTTWKEAKASGVVKRVYFDSLHRRCIVFGALAQFTNLWDSINAKRGYGWDVNPWVWVVKFKMI